MPKLSVEEALQVWRGNVPVMTREQAACYLNVSSRTLQRIERKRGVHIRTEMISGSERCVRYRIEDLKAFLTERSVATRKKEKQIEKQESVRHDS